MRHGGVSSVWRGRWAENSRRLKRVGEGSFVGLGAARSLAPGRGFSLCSPDPAQAARFFSAPTFNSGVRQSWLGSRLARHSWGGVGGVGRRLAQSCMHLGHEESRSSPIAEQACWPGVLVRGVPAPLSRQVKELWHDEGRISSLVHGIYARLHAFLRMRLGVHADRDRLFRPLSNGLMAPTCQPGVANLAD